MVVPVQLFSVCEPPNSWIAILQMFSNSPSKGAFREQIDGAVVGGAKVEKRQCCAADQLMRSWWDSRLHNRRDPGKAEDFYKLFNCGACNRHTDAVHFPTGIRNGYYILDKHIHLSTATLSDTSNTPLLLKAALEVFRGVTLSSLPWPFPSSLDCMAPVYHILFFSALHSLVWTKRG